MTFFNYIKVVTKLTRDKMAFGIEDISAWYISEIGVLAIYSLNSVTVVCIPFTFRDHCKSATYVYYTSTK